MPIAWSETTSTRFMPSRIVGVGVLTTPNTTAALFSPGGRLLTEIGRDRASRSYSSNCPSGNGRSGSSPAGNVATVAPRSRVSMRTTS
jgi:hypothetical protein